MSTHTQSAEYVRIFDTTLRDGEQSPGATLTSTEKLEVAHALARLGVDVIEAGFSAASPDDWAAVKQIAETVGQPASATADADGTSKQPPIICGLARAAKKDIEKAWTAVQPAQRSRIHTFLATSPIHREHKLRMEKKEVLTRISEMVAYARSLCVDVEFSPEDAGRTEPDFLYEALSAAIAAGATTLNIPDTVGYTMPEEFGALIKGIKENVADIEKTTISIHCHNDLGLATANTLAGIAAGARQAEVTINGIGERAGNTSLEEIVMALHTRKHYYGLTTGVDTTRLTRTSKLVSTATGLVVQPNKAIVGANAFAHEAGIHQDGMLKHQTTYEIMRPETVGATQTRLVLGKHSGRHAFAVRLKELGYALEGENLERTFAQFKTLADKKKTVTDADLEAIATTEFFHPVEHFILERLQVSSSNLGIPTATVQIKDAEGHESTVAEVGSGPIDAIYKAIDRIVEVQSELLEYSVHSVTEGIDALGEVSVRIRSAQTSTQRNAQHSNLQRAYYGHGASTDVLVASAKAYVAALNRLISDLEPARMPSLTPEARG